MEASQSLPPPARIVLFSGALEDTFRIPSADSTGRRSRRTGRRLRGIGEPSGEDDGDGIVVIPTLGDSELDEDVRRLLDGQHVLHTRSTGSLVHGGNGGEERPEEEMDVDELESDCLSSYAPSRSSSPGPSGSSQPQSLPQPPSLARLDNMRRTNIIGRRDRERERDPLALRRTSGQPGLRRHRRSLAADRANDVELDQDLAGTCFDPSGEYIYVAATRGISEWKVRGAEQRWWIDSSWA